jgi:hypothetical protein
MLGRETALLGSLPSPGWSHGNVLGAKMDQIILVINGVDILDRLTHDLEKVGYAVSRAALLLNDDSQQSPAGGKAASAPRPMDDPLILYTVRGLLNSEASDAGRTSIPGRELVSTVNSLRDQWHERRETGYSKIVFLGNSGAIHR